MDVEVDADLRGADGVPGLAHVLPRVAPAEPVQLQDVRVTPGHQTLQRPAVQYSTVQYSTVQCSTVVQYSTVQYRSHLSCTCTLLHQMLGWGSPEAWQISRTDSPWLACTF